MSRTRAFLSTALVAVLALASCQKGGAPSGKVEGAAVTALESLPADTNMVVGITWAKLKENKFFKDFTKTMPPESAAMMEEMKKACGLDSMNDMHSIVIGVRGGSDVTFLIKGNWSEDKLAECAAKAPIKGKKVTVAKDGNLTSYTPEGQPAVWATWVAKDTLMATAASVKGDKAALADLLKQKGGLNKDLADLVAKCDTTSTLWGAALGTGDAGRAMGGLTEGTGLKFIGLFGTVDFVKDLDIFATLRFDKDAKPIADKLNGMLESGKKNPQVGEYIKGLTIAAAGNDVAIKLNMPEKQVDELAGMVKQMLPMMLGGGM